MLTRRRIALRPVPRPVVLPATLVGVLVGSTLLPAFMSGCGVAVNKARPQRNRASLITAVLQREEDRIDRALENGAVVDPDEFNRVVDHYKELVVILQKSGSGVPRWRQQAEWELVELGEEIRELPGYQTWSEQEKAQFEELFDRNALRKWRLR